MPKRRGRPARRRLAAAAAPRASAFGSSSLGSNALGSNALGASASSTALPHLEPLVVPPVLGDPETELRQWAHQVNHGTVAPPLSDVGVGMPQTLGRSDEFDDPAVETPQPRQLQPPNLDIIRSLAADIEAAGDNEREQRRREKKESKAARRERRRKRFEAALALRRTKVEVPAGGAQRLRTPGSGVRGPNKTTLASLAAASPDSPAAKRLAKSLAKRTPRAPAESSADAVVPAPAVEDRRNKPPEDGPFIYPPKILNLRDQIPLIDNKTYIYWESHAKGSRCWRVRLPWTTPKGQPCMGKFRCTLDKEGSTEAALEKAIAWRDVEVARHNAEVERTGVGKKLVDGAAPPPLG